MTAHWIAVASAAHVRIGREKGFMQVNHGKLAPLKRINPGDKVAYYSPTEVLGDKIALQAFTAIGVVREGEPYIGHMAGGFVPYRRDVDWVPAQEVSIRPLLASLEVTAGRANWGGAFRFGLLTVTAHDFALIGAAMKADFAIIS